MHCATAKTHRGHKFFDVVKTFESKKQVLQRDLYELEKIINPKYQDIASSILFHKGELKENSKKLISAVVKHGEDLHREIDITECSKENPILHLNFFVHVCDCENHLRKQSSLSTRPLNF